MSKVSDVKRCRDEVNKNMTNSDGQLHRIIDGIVR